MKHEQYVHEAVQLLKKLIATPSLSRSESAAADILEAFLKSKEIEYSRVKNNLIAVCPDYDTSRKTILLNAHIDTVKPAATWTRDPFTPLVEGDRLYGLGSNDCGGGLVSLLQVYRILCSFSRAYNIIYVASAEEEVSGAEGISAVIPTLPAIDVAIVGEPTGMEPAIAEKGLMVIDATAHGVAGHAARDEGANAIYMAMDDIAWLRSNRFERDSELLGPVKTTVTIISAGAQHNVIPDECHFTIDVRTNELYANEEVFELLRANLKSELHARSFRLNSSRLSPDHDLVKTLISMGKKPFGSPTLSDQALMPWPSLKFGPGQSKRSHSADEYICVSEIDDAIDTYLKLLA